jgi:CheY-like chemotaxis protein
MNDQLKDITILVIDDDHDTLELLRTVLEGYGATVLTADSVESALLVCRHSPPHLVLSDMRLGSSDGFALIEAIRHFNTEYRGFTPAIAVTGYWPAGDEARALNAGFNAYLRKPVDPTNLVDTITSVLRNPADFAA